MLSASPNGYAGENPDKKTPVCNTSICYVYIIQYSYPHTLLLQ